MKTMFRTLAIAVAVAGHAGAEPQRVALPVKRSTSPRPPKAAWQSRAGVMLQGFHWNSASHQDGPGEVIRS